MTPELRFRPDARALVVIARTFVYLVCVTLSVLSGDIDESWPLLVALGVVAVFASLPGRSGDGVRWRAVIEGGAAVGLTMATGSVEQALLPYLIAPALDAGLLGGLRSVTYEAGFASAVLIGAGLVQQPDDVTDYTAFAAQWVVLSLAVGLLAAWVRRIRLQHMVTSSSSYAAAYRLLSQLRLVSRQLSGGLDAVVLAQAMLQGTRTRLRYSRAALFIRSDGGRLVPLATVGADRVDWTPAIDDDSPWAQAWSTGAVQRVAQTFSGGEGGYGAVLPLRVGLRTIGVVGVERTEAPFQEDHLAEAVALLDEGALRLETALLFDEVRQLATAEERRRLAREIHDGIAQELASLGYVVDDCPSGATDDDQREPSCSGCARELTPGHQRAAAVDLRPAQRGAPGRRARVRRCPTTSAQVGAALGPHRAPGARRVPAAAARGRRGRAAADRPGGDHQRAQARPGAQPVGDMPYRTPPRARCSGSRTTAEGSGAAARTATGLEIMRGARRAHRRTCSTSATGTEWHGGRRRWRP